MTLPAGCQGGESRLRQVVGLVLAADPALAPAQAEAAITAVAGHPAALRSLAAALTADPGALTAGAPPVIGRLVTELLARGAGSLTAPACTRCGRAGTPLTRTEAGAMCKPCAARRLLIACTHCGEVKPAASRDSTGRRICERCRRRDRGHRPCGKCGKTASIVVRARDGAPDICVSCYKMPEAVCSVCGGKRECNFAGTSKPVCPPCSPRATASCARCGQARPPAARWPEGPVCDPCYTAALRHRGRCASCSQQRRLVAPPGAGADTCADCAGIPVTHACAGCGIEDKLYERGRCERCALRRRTIELLGGAGDQVPAALEGVRDAIISTATPRTALNWLRGGAGARLLAGIASGELACTHQALDLRPRARAADYLRHVLVAGGALPARDEALARMEAWAGTLLAGVTHPEHRRLLHAYATWQVLRRLRRSRPATRGHGPRPAIPAPSCLLPAAS